MGAGHNEAITFQLSVCVFDGYMRKFDAFVLDYISLYPLGLF